MFSRAGHTGTFGRSRKHQAITNMLKRIREKYLGREPDTLEEKLRRNHSISEMVTVNILLTVAFGYVLGVHHYISMKGGLGDALSEAARFVTETYLPLILAIFTWIWFSIYRNAVRREMEILF